ncbi:MAG: hypothetical protein WDM85_14720 [Caulobacteraceae bacterium]
MPDATAASAIEAEVARPAETPAVAAEPPLRSMIEDDGSCDDVRAFSSEVAPAPAVVPVVPD